LVVCKIEAVEVLEIANGVRKATRKLVALIERFVNLMRLRTSAGMLGPLN
jgi:hypothetical protein